MARSPANGLFLLEEWDRLWRTPQAGGSLQEWFHQESDLKSCEKCQAVLSAPLPRGWELQFAFQKHFNNFKAGSSN